MAEFREGATFKYTNEEGYETFYTYLGDGLCAGRDQPLHGTELAVYRCDMNGRLFLRTPENFNEKLELVCNHETRLGNLSNGVITCADCNRRL